ncbi:MAG: hypothetical protein H8E31_00310 [Planctomycetes bacterium]|nr:hypothetical protein [Planctomycetota bacterium]
MRRFRVFGPDCYVSADSQERYALLVRKAAPHGPGAGRAGPPPPRPPRGFRRLPPPEERALADKGPLRAELRAFTAAVRSGGPAPVTGQDGARAVTLAHRIRAAMTTW